MSTWSGKAHVLYMIEIIHFVSSFTQYVYCGDWQHCRARARKQTCVDRDKETGKSRGFAFLAYEDQRSTVIAVDNLSGARVAGRVITVNHVDNYKVKRAEVHTRALHSEQPDVKV